MPQGKGGRREKKSSKAGAARRAVARDLPALKAIMESNDGFRKEWEHNYGRDVAKCQRVETSQNGIESLYLGHLRGQPGRYDIETMPDAIGDLQSLESLYFSGCAKLRVLPDAICGLSKLEYLYLDDCTSLTALPEMIGQLKSLRSLKMRRCTRLTALPDSLGKIRMLRFLHLDGCSNLTSLPELYGLWYLLILSLKECSRLTSLPVSCETLTDLEELDLSYSGIVAIDFAIQEMGDLRKLDLSGCEKLEVVPVQIDTMDGLEVIGAEDTPRFDDESSIWKRLERRWCDGCGQFGLETPRLKICGRCGDHGVRYCSVTCQQSHWEVHREVCSYQRRRKRRECVICARTVEYEDPPFPVCECGTRVYCGEECQAQDWAAGHKLRCASRLRYRPVTPDASADPLDVLAADALAAAVLDDDLDDVDDI
jgi:hypothetical protein